MCFINFNSARYVGFQGLWDRREKARLIISAWERAGSRGHPRGAQLPPRALQPSTTSWLHRQEAQASRTNSFLPGWKKTETKSLGQTISKLGRPPGPGHPRRVPSRDIKSLAPILTKPPRQDPASPDPGPGAIVNAGHIPDLLLLLYSRRVTEKRKTNKQGQ